MTHRLHLSTAILCVLAIACSTEDDVGTGDVSLNIAGGRSLSEGFPHTEGSVTHAFVDGWTAQFDKYVFVVDEVNIGDGGWTGSLAVNLATTGAQGEPLPLLEGLPAERLDVGMVLGRANDDTVAGAGVDSETLSRLKANKIGTIISGSATKGGRTITFDIELDTAARYTNCLNGVDQTRGLVVERNKTTGGIVFVHAIHVFWDRIGEEAELRFDAFAAVAGDDDHITTDELRTQDLNELLDANGDRLLDEDGEPLFYVDDVGNLPFDETTLVDFVAEQVRQAVHFNGIGLCTYTRLD